MNLTEELVFQIKDRSSFCLLTVKILSDLLLTVNFFDKNPRVFFLLLS